jgi:hypothetical protein
MSEMPSVQGGMEVGLPRLQFVNPATGEVLKEIQLTPDMLTVVPPEAPVSEER